MHPNVFLKTFWQLELKPQVFVAMSFDPSHDPRFENVIQPAIEGITRGGCSLKAYRVNNSQTGDSILTDIMDGVAHSLLVLADVSTVGQDDEKGHGYRNGNVMYEVGLALACRQPHEVLLVRDDHEEKFLFDVSTIPHMEIDFENEAQARSALQVKLIERLKEQNFVNDTRVRMAIASLAQEELQVLKMTAGREGDRGLVLYSKAPDKVSFTGMVAYPGLLNKGILKVAGKTPLGGPGYILTELGRIVAKQANSNLPELAMDIATEEPEQSDPPAEGE